MAQEKLALLGGPKTKTTPFGTGKRFGSEELTELKEALDQNTLFYWYGNKVKAFTKKFAEMYGTKHCVATTSGTASIHVALGAVGVGPGDEVITSPITDMGSVIGILYQNTIPVFADLDPHTYNLDPASVEAKITDRTKAIVVVHLAGNAADMDAIMDIAHRHNVRVIEDCAQSYLTRYKGRLCGSIGDIGCFSLNDFKAISAGDGGMLIMNDEDLYLRSLRFADKNYNRLPTSGPSHDVEFLAPNYRMNELTGAVGLAQLGRLEWICDRRNAFGDRLSAGIKDLPGIEIPKILDGCRSTYWFYMLRIDEAKAGADRDQFADALTAEGIPCSKGYIPTCVYSNEMFSHRNIYDGTKCPLECPLYVTHKPDYHVGLCPNAEAILQTAIRLNVNEFYTAQDADEVVRAIRKVADYYRK